MCCGVTRRAVCATRVFFLVVLTLDPQPPLSLPLPFCSPRLRSGRRQVKPELVREYRVNAPLYVSEEQERADRWDGFLSRGEDGSVQTPEKPTQTTTRVNAHTEPRDAHAHGSQQTARAAAAPPPTTTSDGGGGGGGYGQTARGSGGGDPTSLDSTVRRLLEAPEDPNVNKYLRMGYKRDAVIYGLAMMGDKEARVVDFAAGFEQMRGMGFQGSTVAGALACNDNNVEAAIGSCLR